METTTQPQQPLPPVAEKLNPKLEKELNLESLKTRAVSLIKAISRILEDFDAYARTNTTPKWQDILGQYSMVNLELFNIVEEVKKVSNAFVVLPKNVNAMIATILPVMLSSKLLPEMETDDNAKREQLLQGVQNLPIPMQIERLKTRMDMIAAACKNADRVLADTRKAYGFGTRQGPSMLPTMDKGQAAKIQEQENMLRAAVNDGAGTRLPPDQRQISTALPPHLADVLIINDAGKNALSGQSNNINNQGMMQVSGTQFMGRSAASPSGANFDNTTSPLPYTNSPRATGMVNAPSPQQQSQQQQLQQQQRSKLMQLPQHQQQLLAQQQLRQSSMQGLGQTQIPALHDLHGQAQQKFQTLHGQHQMQYSQPMAPHQQFQARQLSGKKIWGFSGFTIDCALGLDRKNDLHDYDAEKVKRFGGFRGLPVNVPQVMEDFLLERIRIGKMIFMTMMHRRMKIVFASPDGVPEKLKTWKKDAGPFATPASSPDQEGSSHTDIGTSSISSSDAGASPFLASRIFEGLKKDDYDAEERDEGT